MLDKCRLVGREGLHADSLLFMAVRMQPGAALNGFAKGSAQIRAHLNVDVEKIEAEEEWERLYCEAVWLERWRNRDRV